jgi:hypothetical protein
MAKTGHDAPPPAEDMTLNMGAGDSDMGAGDVGDLYEMNLNLSDTQEASFEPIPSGLYEAIIDEIEPVESSKGTPMLRVVFLLTEEPYANRKMFHNWMLTPQGQPYLKRYLTALDYDTSKPLRVADLCADVTGLRARIKVRQKMYNGEMVNNVTDILPSKGAQAGSDSELPV